jgi:hypothetical protein
MRTLIMGLAVSLTTTAHAISQQEFAALALKAGGAIVAECPSTVLTKDEVLASGIETGIWKVSTQSKVNGSKQNAYVVNPVIKAAKRGCVYKQQKVDVTKSGSLTIKNM